MRTRSETDPPLSTLIDTAVDRGAILLLVELQAGDVVASPARLTLFTGGTAQPAPCNGAGDTVCRRHLAGTGVFTVAGDSARDTPLVIACSALRASYRAALGDVTFVLLDAPDHVIEERLSRRSGHFASAELLPSQRATLERPDGALVINATLPIATQVSTITSALRTRSPLP